MSDSETVQPGDRALRLARKIIPIGIAIWAVAVALSLLLRWAGFDGVIIDLVGLLTTIGAMSGLALVVVGVFVLLVGLIKKA